MVNYRQKERYTFPDLLEIVAILRGEGGCPWDREQDHHSIRRNMLEEAYEACEAIDADSPEMLCEELGDVLLQVALHTQMEREQGHFDMDAVADGICKKLILRHPHVFSNVSVSGTADVLTNWDAIKRVEKHQKTTEDTLQAVAKSLPALVRAEKVLRKAEKAGYSTEYADPANPIGTELLQLVQKARTLGVDPEEALERVTEGYIARTAREEQEKKA